MTAMQHRLRQLLLGGAFVAAGFTVGALADDHAAQAAPKPPPVEQPGGVLDRAAQLPDKASARAKAVVATVTADRPAQAAKPAKPAKPKAPRVKPTKPDTPHGHTPPVDLPTDDKHSPRPTKPPPPVDLPPPPSPDPVDDVVDQLPLPEPPLDPGDTPTDPAPADVPSPPAAPSAAAPAPPVVPDALPAATAPATEPAHQHAAVHHRRAAAADAWNLAAWCWEPYDPPGFRHTPAQPHADGDYAHTDRNCAPLGPPAPQLAGTPGSGSAPGTACARSADTITLTPPALGRLAHARARSTIPDGPTTLLDPRPA